MLKPPPPPEAYDTLQDTSAAARPVDDFGETPPLRDPIDNLVQLHDMLIEKRRFLAQDAFTYPVLFLGRAQDIADLQKLLNALEEAIGHERALQALA